MSLGTQHKLHGGREELKKNYETRVLITHWGKEGWIPYNKKAFHQKKDKIQGPIDMGNHESMLHISSVMQGCFVLTYKMILTF